MDALKARIEEFSAIKTATCPLCEQDLSEEHRLETLAKMEKEGKEKGDQYRTNTAKMNAIYAEVKNYESRNEEYKSVDKALLSASTKRTRLDEKSAQLSEESKKWQKAGEKRLAEIRKILEEETFSPDARVELAKMDAELKKLGYDF